MLTRLSGTPIAGWAVSAAPAVAVEEGWLRTASLLAAPGLTGKTALKTLPNPLALAVNCLLVPAVSISMLLNVAVPLPSAVPMSRDVVPCNGPAPRLRERLRLRFGGRPTLA